MKIHRTFKAYIPLQTPSAWLTFCLATYRKAVAISERIITDGCNAIRDSYAREAVAISERIFADACDTIRDCYACKS